MLNGQISTGKGLTDLGFGAIGFLGVPGLIVSGIYFGVDSFVPGGWNTVNQQQYNMYMNHVQNGVMQAPWLFGK